MRRIERALNRDALREISKMECECVEPGDGIALGLCAACIARAVLPTKEPAGD